MWDMKCFVTVVIIGAMGIVAEGLKKYLETIPGKYSCTRDITYNKESATIWNLKPEWWGAPLVKEEKYWGKENLW